MSTTPYAVLDSNKQSLTNTEFPLHPGYLIKEEIEARGLKKQDVATSLGMKPGHLSELIREKRNVSAMAALRLEALFGVPAEFWLRVQSSYDLVKAREKLALV